MLCYNRNNVFASIDTNKTNGSQNCILKSFNYLFVMIVMMHNGVF